MQSHRDIIRNLTFLETGELISSLKKLDPESKEEFTISYYNEPKSSGFACWQKVFYGSTYDYNLLRNGLFFNENVGDTYQLEEDGKKTFLSHKQNFKIESLHQDLFKTEINEAINPAVSSIISDKGAAGLSVCCASVNGKLLYKYNLYPRQNAKYYIDTGKDYRDGYYDLYDKTEKNWRKKQPPAGEAIYSVAAENEHIVSVTDILGLKQAYLAIMHDNGKIIIFNYLDQTSEPLNNAIKLNNNQAQDAKLYATPTGLLIAHYPYCQKLLYWNMQNKSLINEIDCPQLSKVTLSHDGAYITGLESKSDTDSSTIADSFQLIPFKHEIIKLKKPVYAFAVGPNNLVSALSTEEKASKNFFIGFAAGKGLEKLGQLDALSPIRRKSIFSGITSCIFSCGLDTESDEQKITAMEQKGSVTNHTNKL